MEVITMPRRVIPLKVTNSFYYTKGSVEAMDCYPTLTAESYEKKMTVGLNQRKNSDFFLRLMEQREQLKSECED